MRQAGNRRGKMEHKEVRSGDGCLLFPNVGPKETGGPRLENRPGPSETSSMFATLVAAGTHNPLLALSSLADGGPPDFLWVLYVLAAPLALLLLCELAGMRYIPHSCVGVIEKLWSSRGSVSEGHIIAMN